MRHTRKSLKETIWQLEIKQEEQKKDFNRQLKTTFESLKPANLIRSTIWDLTHHAGLKNNIFESMISLFSNLISGKMLKKGQKRGFFAHAAATAGRIVLNNFVAKHSHTILDLISVMIDRVKGLINETEIEADVDQTEEHKTDKKPQPEQNEPDVQANLSVKNPKE